MIKLILFVAALLPLPVFGMNADEKDAKKIPLQIRQSERLGRGLLEIPIEATYYGMFSSIQTVVISRLGKVEMVVTNCDTGEYWYDSFDSNAEHQTSCPILGSPGLYEVTYITESGIVYEGMFSINH